MQTTLYRFYLRVISRPSMSAYGPSSSKGTLLTASFFSLVISPVLSDTLSSITDFIHERLLNDVIILRAVAKTIDIFFKKKSLRDRQALVNYFSGLLNLSFTFFNAE
jgi:hypothetical protein